MFPLLKSLLETTSLNELPEDVFEQLKRNITEGAKNLEASWENALELVHKAYEVANVQRPTPSLKEAWKQYEDLIEHAVRELAKHRGNDGAWRLFDM